MSKTYTQNRDRLEAFEMWSSREKVGQRIKEIRKLGRKEIRKEIILLRLIEKIARIFFPRGENAWTIDKIRSFYGNHDRGRNITEKGEDLE